MEKKTEIFEKTLTAKSLIVGLILSICVPMYVMGFYVNIANSFQIPLGAPIKSVVWPYVLGFLFIPMLLSAASSKLRFTRGELAFIYSMFIMPVYLALAHDGAGYARLWFGVTAGLQRAGNKAYVTQYVPAIMGSQISDGALAGITAANHPFGWYPVPWGELATPIIYFTILTVSLWFSLIFGGQILSSVWFRVESLAFPLESAVTRLFDWSTESEGGSKPTLFKQKFMWIGFLIGFLSVAAMHLNRYWPPLSIRDPLYAFTIMNTRVSPTFTSIGYEPWAFGFGLIVPTSVNFTVPLFWIIFFIILYPAFVSVGHFANPLTYSPQVDKWWYEYGPLTQGAPARLWSLGYHPIFIAIGWAAALTPLVWHWRVIYETVKSKEYRVSWVGYAVCTFLFFGMMLVGNVPIHFAFITMFVIFLQYLMNARMLAETGGYIGGIAGGSVGPTNWYGTREYQSLFVLAGSGGNPAGTYPAEHIANYFVGGSDWNNAGGIIHNPTYWSISSFKVGEDVKSPKNPIFIAQIIGIAISVVLVTVYWPIVAYYWSGQTSWFSRWTQWDRAYDLSLAKTPVVGGQAATGPSDLNTLIVYIVSFALGVFLTVAKIKLGGIMAYISPISAYLLAFAGSYLWFPFLICLLAKLLVTRMAGARVVENTLYPLGIGIVLGYCVAWIPTSILMALSGAGTGLPGLGLRWWP